jgi:hypothetical protein
VVSRGTLEPVPATAYGHDVVWNKDLCDGWATARKKAGSSPALAGSLSNAR